MSNSSLTWVAFEYDFPYAYSIRSPLSSAEAALCLPAPGPSTVRLAILRSGIELFGQEYTKLHVFPYIRACRIRISPPKHVAITNHVQKSYKLHWQKRVGEIVESVAHRNYAVASGCMTLYIESPLDFVRELIDLCSGVGYWGTADSFAQLISAKLVGTIDKLCAEPLGIHTPAKYYCSFLSEFSSSGFKWEEIVESTSTKNPPFSILVYAWPMMVDWRSKSGMILSRE